jgi:hypothetical protein
MQQPVSRAESRAERLRALRASASGGFSACGASDTPPRHACVSQEHATLAKDIATSLLEVHKKSHCSQVPRIATLIDLLQYIYKNKYRYKCCTCIAACNASAACCSMLQSSPTTLLKPVFWIFFPTSDSCEEAHVRKLFTCRHSQTM